MQARKHREMYIRDINSAFKEPTYSTIQHLNKKKFQKIPLSLIINSICSFLSRDGLSSSWVSTTHESNRSTMATPPVTSSVRQTSEQSDPPLQAEVQEEGGNSHSSSQNTSEDTSFVSIHSAVSNPPDDIVVNQSGDEAGAAGQGEDTGSSREDVTIREVPGLQISIPSPGSSAQIVDILGVEGATDGSTDTPRTVKRSAVSRKTHPYPGRPPLSPQQPTVKVSRFGRKTSTFTKR